MGMRGRPGEREEERRRDHGRGKREGDGKLSSSWLWPLASLHPGQDPAAM